jgi:two-component system LytT family sensor kinase
LQFIDSYYHLLQTRYGNGLSLTVTVGESHRNCQLPPLTLQLLVENAVKHNVISPRKPLVIGIEIDEQDRLVVYNTLQRKATRAFSNGVGLSNIVAKYQMLNLFQPTVEESEDRFTVRLPLIAAS